jgi:signal transduction histidine kinase
MIAAAELRRIDLFEDLDEAALEAFAAAAQERTFAAEACVGDQGDNPEGVMLLLEGTLLAEVVENGRAELVGHQRAPTWIHAVAVLTGASLGVRMTAESACRIGMIGRDDFRALAFAHPQVHDRVMRQVAPVMSRITAVEQSRERLTSLGTMAAGLAHELNNPAAAARRAAAELAEAVDTVVATLSRFVEAGVEREAAEGLLALQDEALRGAEDRSPLDALDAADAEDELRDELEALGVEEAWRVAEPLAAAGVDADWLARTHALAGEATSAAVQWVAATLNARTLAADVQESTARMSALVGAVKTYAYMDRGELVEVDLHEGLETTLAVLGHKLKHTQITVVREYDRDLGRLTVHGSELNQVWTNLLDNAIDALGQRGTITIRTAREGRTALVQIGDDGPGIPPEVREHVFDDFFTTKEVGKGTGLGLATARRIVVDRHGGALGVESAPGRTVFSVRLPR